MAGSEKKPAISNRKISGSIMTIRIGLLGARGYVGSEFIRIISAHPQFELGFVSSRERAGQQVASHEDSYQGELEYVNLDAEQAAQQSVEALILALPNNMANEYVAEVDKRSPQTVLLDLSADYRFDSNWHYGLPELTRANASGKKRISNPGCYATAMQLAIAPMAKYIEGPVQCFGVSGYSGAGTSPSDKNNPEKLRDNVMPYHLAGHIHEREVAFHSKQSIEFMPHVAAHFRGLSVTTNMHLKSCMKLQDIIQNYRDFYTADALIETTDSAPWISECAGKHGVKIGGFTLSDDGKRLVVVSALDNLLKGAASQAIQNLNLAFGLDELAGINHE
jgi:N-acetyl-gamma-glutamyl-phosphate reductase